MTSTDDPKEQEQGGWGWGSWGFSVLTDLQKAATEAAEEISKNAMEAAKGAAKGMAGLQSTVVESLADRGHESDGDDGSPGEALRKNALRRLESASRGSSVGHVLDTSMESLASGAYQALGSAWKGGVSLVHKLESSAEQFAGSVQSEGLTAKASTLAPKLIQSGKELTAKGIKALEYVGKETMEILALDGIDGHGQKHDGENALEDATFSHCFYIYGGPEHLEELEAMATHYTLVCNRAKSKMSREERAVFDDLSQQIPQALTLGDGGDSSPGSDKGKQVEAGLMVDGSEVKSLREASVGKAAEMATSFSTTLGGLAVGEVVQKTSDRIEAIRAEGVHRLSELCAVCVSQLVLVGRSLLAGKSEEFKENEFKWPDDCLSKALVIRSRARSMATDIEAVSDCFVTGIGDVVAAFQAADMKDEEQAAPTQSMENKAVEMCSELRNDGSAAVGKLQDALGQLVYVLLSTSLSPPNK